MGRLSEPRTLPQLVVLAFEFACATGMRIGEILQLHADWINGNTIHLPKEITKTGFKRDVALSSEAKRLLALAENFGGYSRSYFSALDSQQRDALWRKIRDMADLGPKRDKNGLLLEEGLNFHDSRATFATWAASIDPVTNKPRLDVLALAKQTGHRDLAMLQRYYRANSSVIQDGSTRQSSTTIWLIKEKIKENNPMIFLVQLGEALRTFSKLLTF